MREHFKLQKLMEQNLLFEMLQNLQQHSICSKLSLDWDILHFFIRINSHDIFGSVEEFSIDSQFKHLIRKFISDH